MSEAELQAKIEALCDELGLWHYHAHFPIGDDRGWPDLVIIGGHGVLFRELKSNTGVLSSEQKRVGWKLKAAGENWAVWWPMDFSNGNIERQLEEIA